MIKTRTELSTKRVMVQIGGECDACGADLVTMLGDTPVVNYFTVHNRECGYGSRYDMVHPSYLIEIHLCDDCYERLIASNVRKKGTQDETE